MSRCFPYPPPGYCKNGATYEALIESIKLQKETDKAKAERKKEKRAKKEKKEKKKLEKENKKKDEKLKLQKNQIQDSQKGSKPSTQLLEKSDLTEEHGQPIKPTHSSDSTQNSNKRRRDDDGDDNVLVPDDSTGHGKPIKIRFPKKQKGSDSTISGADARFNTAPRTPHTAPATSLTQTKLNPGFEKSKNINTNGLMLHVSRERTPATSLIQPKSNIRSEKKKNINPNGLMLHVSREHTPATSLTQPKSNISSEKKKNINPNGLMLHLSREHTPGTPFTQPKSNSGFASTKNINSNAVSASARPILPSGLKRSRQQSENSVIPVGAGQHLKQERPISHVSRDIGSCGLNQKPVIPNPVLNKPGPSSTGKRPISEELVSRDVGSHGFNLKPVIPGSVLNKPGPSSTGKQPVNEDPVLNKPGPPAPSSTRQRPINEMTFPVGPTTEPKKKEEQQKVGPTRSEKKMLEKHAKYEKLIGSWVPPVIGAPSSDVVGDEDWLSRRRTETENTSISKGETETCRELAETSLWQPRARFLSDVGIYALPYTIPW